MKREPYSDLGLIVAVAAFIIMIVKSLLFDLSWSAIVWTCITVGYFVISYKYTSDSKTVKRATTAYLVLSVIALVSLVVFDKNARPKIHAFEGAATDTIVEEEFIIEDKELPYEAAPADSVEADTLELSETDFAEEADIPLSQSPDSISQ